MASRRLAISSLLCDDDPPLLDHVVDHNVDHILDTVDPVHDPPEPVVLAPHLKISNRSPFFHPRPSSSRSPQDHHPQLPYLGLEALVHAATEERRRLSVGSGPTDQDSLPSPHNSLSQRSHLRSPSRELYPRPFDHSPTPYEYRIQSPYASHQHRPHDDSQPQRLRPVDDIHRPSYFPSSPASTSHSPTDHDLIHQQQQLELLRQRQHHEQLLLKEQQQQRQLAVSRDRQLAYPSSSASPPLPPPPRVPSMPLHLQLPSPSFLHTQLGPLNTSRKSDPELIPMISQKAQARPTSAHLNLILSQNSPPDDDSAFYPIKKRRYSDSPVPPIALEERGRLSPDHKLVTAELNHQHVDPLVVAIPPRSPTQPASAHERKPTAVVDLVIPDREKERARSHVVAIENQRDEQAPLKLAGRRPSPGSQAGKAKAARKSEDQDASLVPKDRAFMEIERPRVPDDRQALGKERRRSHTRPATEVQTVEEPTSKVKETQEVPRRPRPPSYPPSKSQDAHEWFLEHYDDVPLHSIPDQPAASPRQPSPVPPQVVVASSSKKRMPTPATMPEAAVALEQELEGLMVNSPTIPSKIEPDIDMDVDLVVTELVAETLERDAPQHIDVGMEVDVEDELLSLVDDRPSVPHISRRTSGSALSATLTSSIKHPPFQAPGSSEARQGSPSAVSNASFSGAFSPTIRSSSARPSERGSMPPPSIAPGRGKDRDEKKTERASSVTTTAPAKKKDGASKAKPKTASGAAKPRAKPAPKTKPKDADATVASAKTAKTPAAPAAKKAGASRSRSASTMPGGSVGPEGEQPKAEKQEEEEGSDGHADDKLYCVCKTKYDEDRFMIACDRCDEWYHTQCVNMPDLEVDLVDQFICPPCVERNPHLSPRTTYKRRCLFGLKHADPDSAKACHKPARGAFSKYCSDECGVKYMQTRLDAWAKKGGKKDKLWESVKDAEKREGIVISVEDGIVMKDEGGVGCKREEVEIKPRKRKVERELERLNSLLDRVVKLREEIKKGMEVVVWREKLIELASERAEQVNQCGWDQRLCFGDDEWADFGAGVLESYEDVKVESNQGDMQVDSVSEDLGEWWCPGKKMCDRHAGWQAVRQKDVCQEKEKKEEALSNLTTREREIRKRIEDIIDPQGRNCTDPDDADAKLPSLKQPNGSSRGKANADASKKGKKRKAPS